MNMEDDRTASPPTSSQSSDVEEDVLAAVSSEDTARHAQQAIDDQSLLRELTDLEHDAPKQLLHFFLLDGMVIGARCQDRVARAQTWRGMWNSSTGKGPHDSVSSKRKHVAKRCSFLSDDSPH